MKTKFLLLVLLYTQFCTSQDGILLNTPDATNGYSLFSTSGSTYLVDNCGEIVKTWPVYSPTRHCKLLPDGNLIYMTSSTITELNWNNQVVNSVQLNELGLVLEYEVVKLKNGNYLCVAREEVSLQRFQEYGYDIPNTFPTQSDVVVELDGNSGKVVWRWNLLDHVIQDKFPAKKAYGVIKDHPEKININAIATFDWEFTESFMINGMDYNEDLDQIVLSVRKVCEIVIIDHSTTTEQAKGSTGGKYNKGGDLLYRYGNPANYKRATLNAQQLYFQHNPNWIKYGEHKGKIMVFNNLLSKESYSTVQIIDPPIKPDGSYTLENDQPYMPLTPAVEYGATQNKVKIWSGYTSGAKVLPNGNIVITEGRTAKIYEIDPEGNVLWNYAVPLSGYLFRSERYSHDYPAFIGKQLTPMGNIESPPSNYACSLYSSTNETADENKVIFKQYSDLINISSSIDFEMRAYNLQGQLLSSLQSQNQQIDWVHNLSDQIVILQIIMGNQITSKKVFIY